MSTVAFTPQEWADRLARPIKDRAYQSTRTGQAVAFEYLPWKRLTAAARSLDQIERDLARGCMAFPDHAIEDWSAGDIITVLNLFPDGSQRRALAHWRGFLGWAADWKDVPELHRQLRLLPKMKARPMPVYDLFEPWEQERLLRGTEDSWLPARDRLAMRLVTLGPRKGEMQQVRLEHFNQGSRVVTFHGKGNKERIVPYDDETHIDLLEFLNEPIPRVRMRDRKGAFLTERLPLPTDYLMFPSGAKDRLLWTNPTKAMSSTALHRWWGRRIAAAGIRYRHLHIERHTAGTELVEADVNAFDVRDWLGHANVNTTQVYVHNARSRLRGASNKLAAHRRKAED